jgi:transposase
MLKEDRTVAETASEFGVHPTMLQAWRREFEGKAASIFEDKRKRSEPAGTEKLNEHLYKQIGQLKVGNDFLKAACDMLNVKPGKRL